jgi:hypothetical protein
MIYTSLGLDRAFLYFSTIARSINTQRFTFAVLVLHSHANRARKNGVVLFWDVCLLHCHILRQTRVT